MNQKDFNNRKFMTLVRGDIELQDDVNDDGSPVKVILHRRHDGQHFLVDATNKRYRNASVVKPKGDPEGWVSFSEEPEFSSN